MATGNLPGHRLMFTVTFLVALICPVSAQQPLTVSGIVRSKANGEAIPGVNVVSHPGNRGSISDQRGTWRLETAPGDRYLVLSHIGFRNDTIDLTRNPGIFSFDIVLEPKTVEIGAARIIAQAETWKIRDLAPGQIRLSVNEISKVPALFGEQDLLNTLHSLPGVQSVGEGSGYLHIRGGNADQNLILLDEAVLYNPSHLLGIFSVVNPSVVQSVSIYKSGIPAGYGDRLASVIDLTGREGNFQKFTGEASIGLIASKVFMEGPLVRDKISVLLAIRRTQLDLITPFLLPKSSILHGSGYSFLDANGRITWNLTNRQKLWLTLYTGSDRFTLKDREYSLTDRMIWGNQLYSLNHQLALSNGGGLRTSLSWSGYALGFEQLYHDYYIGLQTGIGQLRLKQEYSRRITEKQEIRMGFELQQFRFSPYQSTVISQADDPVGVGDSLSYRSREAALFVHHEWNPARALSIQSGIRITYYQQVGPFDRFIPDANGFLSDTLHYSKGEVLASYFRAEPRLSLSWQFIPGQTLKLSASRQYQPVHMVPVATTTLPLDLWMPSTDLIRPQAGTSFSLGWYPDLDWAGLEGYADGFYRHFENQLEFVEDQSILGFFKDNIDRQLTTGTGRAYGFELFLRKKSGTLQGWIGYTWSRAWRYFPELNGGKPFHPRHDRTHDFNLVLTRTFNEKWDGSLQFVFATGQPTTIPVSVFVMNGTIVQNFSERNSIRLPSYHRVDLAFTKKGASRKRLQSTWTFSVYNLYNRLNPFFIYYDLQWDYEKNLLSTRTRQVALLPVLPSVTWTGRF